MCEGLEQKKENTTRLGLHGAVRFSPSGHPGPAGKDTYFQAPLGRRDQPSSLSSKTPAHQGHQESGVRPQELASLFDAPSGSINIGLG